MKQNNDPLFVDSKILSFIKKETPFFLRGFDFRLLPILLSFIEKRVFFLGFSAITKTNSSKILDARCAISMCPL